MNLAAVATAAGVAFTLGWASRQPEIQAVRREANTDRLTGLANRSALMHHLHIRARRQAPYTVLLLDLNHFKPVNDTHGHRAGDELLRALAHRLTWRLAGNFVARLGGDEFVVIADGRLGPAANRVLAERIQRAMAQPVALNEVAATVRVGAAVGIAVATGGEDPRAVLHTADLAMYRSKALGAPHQVTASARIRLQEAPRNRLRDIRQGIVVRMQ